MEQAIRLFEIALVIVHLTRIEEHYRQKDGAPSNRRSAT
jgi:hypothetical protein